jgi:hypothetical protein
MRVAAVGAALWAAAAVVPGVRGDWFKQYLDQKVFGPNPGPCSPDPCTGDIKNLPQSIKDIPICLTSAPADCDGDTIGNTVKSGFYSFKDVVCEQVSVQSITFSHVKNPTAKSLDGRLDINNMKLKCSMLATLGSLSNLLVVERNNYPKGQAGSYQLSFFLKDFKLEFDQSVQADGTRVWSKVYFKWDPATSFLTDTPKDIRIPVEECNVTPNIKLDFALQRQRFDYLKACFHIGIGGPACVESTGLITGLIFSFINWDRVLEFIWTLLAGVFGRISCEVTAGLAYYGVGGSLPTQPGWLNLLWADIKKQIDEAALNVPDNVRLVDTDAEQLRRLGTDLYCDRGPQMYQANRCLTQADLNASVDFSTSNTVEVVSVALNDWLGGPGTVNPNTLTINEVVNKLTSPQGEYATADLAGDQTYNLEYPGGPAVISVQLAGLKLTGLNTFTKFKILQNGYGLADNLFQPFRRTFTNNFSLTKLGVVGTVLVTLRRGSWVSKSCNSANYGGPAVGTTCNACAPGPGQCANPSAYTDDTEQFYVQYAAKVNNAEVDIGVNMLVNPSELDTLTLGRINQVGTFQNAAELEFLTKFCLAKAVYNVFLPSLSLKMSGIEAPSLYLPGPNVGLATLVDNSGKFLADAVQGALQSKLPGLFQGPLRRTINDLLWDRLVLPAKRFGFKYCPDWSLDLDAPARVMVDFSNRKSLAYNLYPLINDVLGGNPVVQTDTDVNKLVDSVLKFYELKGWPIDSWNNVTAPPRRFPLGYWELRDEYQSIAKAPAFRKPDNWFWFTNFSANGIASIYKLTAVDTATQTKIPNAVNLTLGVGGPMGKPGGGLQPAQPLQAGFSFNVRTRDASLGGGIMDETWQFDVIAEQVQWAAVLAELWYEPNSLNVLTVTQARHLPCLLNALNRIAFPSEDRLLTVARIDFQINPLVSAGCALAAPTPFQKHLCAAKGLSWANFADFTANGNGAPISSWITTRRFRALTRAALKGLLNWGLDTVEAIPDSYAGVSPATCLGVTSPADELPSVSLGVPNFTYFDKVCLADLRNATQMKKPVNVVEQFEVLDLNPGRRFVDLQTSSLASALNTVLNDAPTRPQDKTTLQKVLFQLANETDDANVLSKYFALSKDAAGKDQVDLVFPLEMLGLRLQSLEVVPGLDLNAGTLRVEGVDKALRDSAKLFVPVGRMTWNHRLEFSPLVPLRMRVNAYVSVPSNSLVPFTELVNGANPEAKDKTLRDEIELTFNVTGLTVDLNTVLAVDDDKFGNLTLGHLFRSDAQQNISLTPTWDKCLLSTLLDNGMFISYLDVNVSGPVQGPTLVVKEPNSLVGPSIAPLLDDLVKIFKDFYLAALPNICDNCVRTWLNDYAAELVAAAPAQCPAAAKIPPPPLAGAGVFYRFNQALDFQRFQDFVRDYLAVDDLRAVNSILTAATSKVLFDAAKGNQFLLEDVPIIYDGRSYGRFSAQVSDMTVSGLNVAAPADGYNFTLFEPFYWLMSDKEMMDYCDENCCPCTRRRQLVNVNTSTYPEKVDVRKLQYLTLTQFFLDKPVEITARYQLNVSDFFPDLPNMRNDLRVKVTLQDLNFALQLLSKINITKALGVRFSSVSSLDELPCLLVPFAELEPQQFKLLTSGVQISVECLTSCDLFKQFGLDKGGQLSNTNSGQIAGLINEFIKWFTAYIDSRGAQGFIDTYLKSAEVQCARILGLLDELTTVPRSVSQDVFAYMGAGFAVLLGVAGLVTLGLFPAHKKRREAVMALVVKKNKGNVDEGELAGIMVMMELTIKSLFQHPQTPLVAKYVVPVVCLLNVLGLIVAILFVDAANIIIKFTLLSQTTQPVQLVPFTIVSTINYMWNSGAYPLAVLIALASCAWPILKNLMLLALWFTPATIVRPRRRHAILSVLDLLGKWSFLDVYVIVIMLAALRTYVRASYVSYVAFLNPNFFVVEVSVSPEAGIIMLCFIAASSLLVNHVIVIMDNRVLESNRVTEDKVNGNFVDYGKVPARAALKRAVAKHVFIGKDKNGLVRKVSRRGTMVLMATTFLGGVLTIVGSMLPLITFEQNGLIGLLLQLIEEGKAPGAQFESQLKVKTYSIYSLGTGLSAAPSDTAGQRIVILFFQALYFINVLVGPVLTMVLTFALLTRAFSLPSLNMAIFWTHIASYWSAVEVLFVALVATIIEIGPVTQFIVDFITNDVCGYVQAAIQLAVEDAAKDGSCLDVVGRFEVGAVPLFIGVACLLFAFYATTTLARAVADDRYFAAYHELRNDVKPKQLGWLQKKVVRWFTVTEAATVDGIEGVSAFYGVDDVENGYKDLPKSGCDAIFDWCCSAEAGNKATDERINAWHAKFGVQASPLPPADNPVFEGSPASMRLEPFKGGNSPALARASSFDTSPTESAAAGKSAKVRGDSDVEV